MTHILPSTPSTLLIVPYGIETSFCLSFNDAPTLLIVPYGIETYNELLYCHSFPTFNRTLWN